MRHVLTHIVFFSFTFSSSSYRLNLFDVLIGILEGLYQLVGLIIGDGLRWGLALYLEGVSGRFVDSFQSLDLFNS